MRKKPLIAVLALSAVGAAMIPVVRKLRQRGGAATLDRSEPHSRRGEAARPIDSSRPAGTWNETARPTVTPSSTPR